MLVQRVVRWPYQLLKRDLNARLLGLLDVASLGILIPLPVVSTAVFVVVVPDFVDFEEPAAAADIAVVLLLRLDSASIL